jgi:hypothetical protein
MQPVPFFYFLCLVFDDVGMLMFLEKKKKPRLLHLFSTDLLYCTITCCLQSCAEILKQTPLGTE